MTIRDALSMRQRPRGLFKWLLRAPNVVFHLRLGWMLGDRFILVTSTGRRSGRAHRTVLEVVEHDNATNEYIVCSGTGPRADWYRNLQAGPPHEAQVGNERWRPIHRFLSAEQAAVRFAAYEWRHPQTAVRLLRTMGNRYDGTDRGRVEMMADMPMVAIGGKPD